MTIGMGRGAGLWGQGCSFGPKLFGRLPSTSTSSLDGLERLEIDVGGAPIPPLILA